MTSQLASPHVPTLSLRHELRRRTASAHDELDAAVGVLGTVERYGCYLNGQLVFRHAMEAALAGAEFPGWFDGWRPQGLSGAIRADLADLRLPEPGYHRAAAASRHLDDPSGLIGILYVLEGASLGARFLYAGARALGLSASHGARHLELQAGGDSWHGFLRLLDHDGIDREKAAEAAVATFAFARDVFAKEMHEQP